MICMSGGLAAHKFPSIMKGDAAVYLDFGDKQIMNKSKQGIIMTFLPEYHFHPYFDTRFTIKEKWADDIEEEGKSKSVGNRKGNKITTTTND